MSEQQMIEISLPSELGYEKVATSAMATLAQHMGFSGERIDDLKTALSEAVINSIEHGTPQDPFSSLSSFSSYF